MWRMPDGSAYRPGSNPIAGGDLVALHRLAGNEPGGLDEQWAGDVLTEFAITTYMQNHARLAA